MEPNKPELLGDSGKIHCPACNGEGLVYPAAELLPSKERASDFQLNYLREIAREGDRLDSQLVAGWLLEAICDELVERRAAPEPPAAPARRKVSGRSYQAAITQCEQLRERVRELEAKQATPPPAPEWQPIETAPKDGNFQVCLDSCPDLSWPAHSNNGELWSKAHGPLNRMVQGRFTKATHWRPAHSPPTKPGEQS